MGCLLCRTAATLWRRAACTWPTSCGGGGGTRYTQAFSFSHPGAKGQGPSPPISLLSPFLSPPPRPPLTFLLSPRALNSAPASCRALGLPPHSCPPPALLPPAPCAPCCISRCAQCSARSAPPLQLSGTLPPAPLPPSPVTLSAGPRLPGEGHRLWAVHQASPGGPAAQVALRHARIHGEQHGMLQALGWLVRGRLVW